MKRSLSILFSICVFSILQGQDVIYTISGQKDGNSTVLSSIVIENISNGTQLLFENLPVQDKYIVNLTKQSLETPTGIVNPEIDKTYRVIKNIPGEISVLYTSNIERDIDFFLYNSSGQEVFNGSVKKIGNQTTLTVKVPIVGMYILRIHTSMGELSFKMMGTNDFGAINYSIKQNSSSMKGKTSEDHYFKKTSAFTFQPGDSLNVKAYLGANITYPAKLKITGSESIILFFENEYGNYIEVSGVKYPLDSGYNVWLSELDCGNLDVFAHALHLASNIFFKEYVDATGGLSLLPQGKGNVLVFNMFSKNSTLVDGQYNFVDDIDCYGIITDGGNSYQMDEKGKYVSVIKEMVYPTHYGLNVDVDIAWESIDLSNPPAEVVEKWNNYLNSTVRFKEGNVNIKSSGGIFTITFSCIDSNGINVTGQYTGSLKYIEFGI